MSYKTELNANNADLQTILGKVNALPDALDTSDATATAADIVSGKTAYVNGVKVTGNLVPTKKTYVGKSTSTAQYSSGDRVYSGKEGKNSYGLDFTPTTNTWYLIEYANGSVTGRGYAIYAGDNLCFGMVLSTKSALKLGGWSFYTLS